MPPLSNWNRSNTRCINEAPVIQTPSAQNGSSVPRGKGLEDGLCAVNLGPSFSLRSETQKSLHDPTGKAGVKALWRLWGAGTSRSHGGRRRLAVAHPRRWPLSVDTGPVGGRRSIIAQLRRRMPLPEPTPNSAMDAIARSSPTDLQLAVASSKRRASRGCIRCM